jgi:hypothetical protein
LYFPKGKINTFFFFLLSFSFSLFFNNNNMHRTLMKHCERMITFWSILESWLAIKKNI